MYICPVLWTTQTSHINYVTKQIISAKDRNFLQWTASTYLLGLTRYTMDKFFAEIILSLAFFCFTVFETELRFKERGRIWVVKRPLFQKQMIIPLFVFLHLFFTLQFVANCKPYSLTIYCCYFQCYVVSFKMFLTCTGGKYTSVLFYNIFPRATSDETRGSKWNIIITCHKTHKVICN